jgi:DNA-binding transcriptional ArsR family regulator
MTRHAEACARRPLSTINYLSAAAMLRALVDGPATTAEIVEETGVAIRTVRLYVRAMRQQRLIYVARWEADSQGRRKTAAYLFGPDKSDAPNPPRESRVVIVRRYRSRVRVRTLHAAIVGPSTQATT